MQKRDILNESHIDDCLSMLASHVNDIQLAKTKCKDHWYSIFNSPFLFKILSNFCNTAYNTI